MQAKQIRLSNAPETANPIYQAMDELIAQTEGHSDVAQHLEEMYLCWACSELASGADGFERRGKFMTIKHLTEALIAHQTLARA